MTQMTCSNQTKELELAREHFDQFLALHELQEHTRISQDTLTGDYHFSQFSLHLIPVDSVEITDAFAKELREYVCGYECPELEQIKDENPKHFTRGKKLLEDQLEKICFSQNEQMKNDLMRVLLAGGKRLRPALSWAAYNLLTDTPPEGKQYPILPLMVMIELMHSASLIHDDVVDKADVRRNVATINATSGDKMAVKSADFILGRAMELLKVYKGSGIDERLASVSEQMCLGELDQLENLHKDISEEQYIQQIERKTALFIEAAAACGGMARGLDEEAIRCLEQYGYHIGMAFQIKDDILDEIGGEEFGKQKNQDRKRGLKTLPQIIGLAKSEEAVKAHSDQAIQALQKLPESSAKNDLVKMAKILVERTK